MVVDPFGRSPQPVGCPYFHLFYISTIQPLWLFYQAVVFLRPVAIDSHFCDYSIPCIRPFFRVFKEQSILWG